MEYLPFLIRITACFVLGIIIGVERQCRRKIAGIRTITLVSLGAFLFVSISKLTTSNDITRIAAQVVSGMGFLGAGVILRDGTNIRGLNTAATLWCAAAIGTLTALGFIVEAVIGVTYILLSNLLLRFISRKMTLKTMNKNKVDYIVKVLCSLDKEMVIKNMLIQKLKSNQSKIKSFFSEKEDDGVRIEMQLELLSNSTDMLDNLVNKVCIEPGVTSVEYNKLSSYADDDDDDYEVK